MSVSCPTQFTRRARARPRNASAYSPFSCPDCPNILTSEGGRRSEVAHPPIAFAPLLAGTKHDPIRVQQLLHAPLVRLPVELEVGLLLLEAGVFIMSVDPPYRVSRKAPLRGISIRQLPTGGVDPNKAQALVLASRAQREQQASKQYCIIVLARQSIILTCQALPHRPLSGVSVLSVLCRREAGGARARAQRRRL